MGLDFNQFKIGMEAKGFRQQPDGSWKPGTPEQTPACSDVVERESELHEEIRRACAARGWLPLHGSMAHKTARTIGEPDYIIFAEHPRVFIVELKTRLGKLRPEQVAVFAWLKRLGWRPTVCRSIAEPFPPRPA